MRFNFRLFFRLTYRAFFKSRGTHGRLTFKRIKSLLGWYIIFPTHNLLTWFCFLLDEIFFHGYRDQKIEAPIFIIGNFRSGSTLLQRLMAKDDANLIAMKTWEIYVSPSIIQRKFWKLVERVDRRYFEGRLAKFLAKVEAKQLGTIPMHRVALHEVDEDEGILLHNWASSFLVFIFPFPEIMCPYLHFDSEMTEKEKKRAMDFYYRMVQKHVYYHGGRRYIAKNPAFSSKVDALRNYFPDAKFIYLVRNPVDMLASKTSFFAYIWKYFNEPYEPYPFREFLLELTRSWYVRTLKTLEALPKSEYLILKYRSLVEDLDATTRVIFNHFRIPLTREFEAILCEAEREAANYVSKHQYSLIEMGYSAERVYQQYEEIFDRFGFNLKTKALMADLSKKYAEID